MKTTTYICHAYEVLIIALTGQSGFNKCLFSWVMAGSLAGSQASYNQQLVRRSHYGCAVSDWYWSVSNKYPCLGRVRESKHCSLFLIFITIFSPNYKQMIPEYSNACTTVWHIRKKLPRGGLVWLLLVRQSGSTV